jgi:hypothetical protein
MLLGIFQCTRSLSYVPAVASDAGARRRGANARTTRQQQMREAVDASGQLGLRLGSAVVPRRKGYI